MINLVRNFALLAYTFLFGDLSRIYSNLSIENVFFEVSAASTKPVFFSVEIVEFTVSESVIPDILIFTANYSTCRSFFCEKKEKKTGFCFKIFVYISKSSSTAEGNLMSKNILLRVHAINI